MRRLLALLLLPLLLGAVSPTGDKLVISSTVTNANMTVTLTDGSADIDFTDYCTPCEYRNCRIEIKDSSGRPIIGYVGSAGAGTVSNIVSTKGGATQNWAYKDGSFDDADASGYTYRIYETSPAVAASGSISNANTTLVLTDGSAYAELTGVDLGPYQTGQYLLAVYDNDNYAVIGAIDPTAPGTATAANIMSRLEGTTQNWLSKHVSFNNDDADDYTYKIYNAGQQFEHFAFDVVSTQTISGAFNTNAADGYILVDWGDGTQNTYAGTANQAYSKDYGSVGNRRVRILRVGTGYMLGFNMYYGVGSQIEYNIANLPRCTQKIYDSIGGASNVSGDIAYMPPAMIEFQIRTSNTLYGDVADLPAGVTYFFISGNNTINAYTGKSWSTKPETFILVPVAPGGLDESEINQLLIDLDDDFAWTSGTIELTGTNANPTGLGLAAADNMANEGATVKTNLGTHPIP